MKRTAQATTNNKSTKRSNFVTELKDMEPLATKATTWPRKPVASIDPKKDSIAFQWIDIGMYDGTPLLRNPKQGQSIPGSTVSPTPIIRLCGTTESGNSVVLHVHGFVPYFYCSCPPGFKEEDCHLVRKALERQLATSTGSSQHIKEKVLGVDIKHDLMSIYGYHFDKKSSYFIIYMAMPTLVAKARTIMTEGMRVDNYGVIRGQTYESNVPFVLRFMIDRDIAGCNWLELPAGSYSLRNDEKKQSLCQIEADIVYLNIISHTPEGPWGKLAPLRILSFDIECMGRKGHFPDAEQDPVIQIANIVQEQGSDTPIIRNVFVLGTCKPIVGAHVLEFQDERALIEAWAAFVREVDPDVMTGYNIDNFDVPYIMNRGKALKLMNHDVWGRLKNQANYVEKKSFSSAQYGKSESVKTTVHGRCMFDLYPIMRRTQNLSSYSLNSVSAAMLGQQKEDVPHGIISDLQMGSDDDRHRLAVYCLKDAYLPMQLTEKLSCLVNYIEMARVTGVPLDYLIDRGQQIKVFSMILRKCKKYGLIVPLLPRNTEGDSSYEGATVIDPKKAYYTVPIATLDFASLYPSIMQAYNLCFSTLVARGEVKKLQPSEYATSPSGDVFVTSAKKKGILPLILEELLSARKRAKKDMKNATDPMEKAVQNGRQLALKVSANSVYGFTGANVGQLPCIPIASSVTAYGRQLLLNTREEVERIFTMENGYPANAEVVYGDTDSVMIKFGVDTVAETMPLAIKAAECVSNIFPSPIKLEFEKVYFPYLLMNKKRYAGLLWTNSDKYDKLDSKGLETVRRDNCLLVRRMVSNCLKKILIDRDVEGALNYTKRIISDLLQSKTDISMLVITKGLNKSANSSDYKSKTAHTELAMRMHKRDPGSAPVLGERIAYVIVDKGKKVPMYEKSEDPVYALEHNIPLDCDYYLTNQLQNPLERIFEPIIGEGKVKSELFAGSHTLKRAKPILKQNSGGMMNFAIKKLKCLACKAPLQNKAPFCRNCSDQEQSVYLEKLAEMNHLSLEYTRLWTQCQDCQGSLHQDVLCTSRDCPIFYKRIKVQKDLDEANKTLDRFQVDW